MKFAIYALDKPDAISLRTANRQAHLQYVHGSGKMSYGSPLLTDDGQMIGSLILIDVKDRAEAEDFLKHDPYNKAGLFASISVTRVID